MTKKKQTLTSLGILRNSWIGGHLDCGRARHLQYQFKFLKSIQFVVRLHELGDNHWQQATSIHFSTTPVPAPWVASCPARSHQVPAMSFTTTHGSHETNKAKRLLLVRFELDDEDLLVLTEQLAELCFSYTVTCSCRYRGLEDGQNLDRSQSRAGIIASGLGSAFVKRALNACTITAPMFI